MERERGKRGPLARATIRRIPPEPPRFPGLADPDEPEVPDESRVARRRASVPSAHEVQMDELEILGPASVNAPAALRAMARAPSPTLPPPLPKRAASVHALPPFRPTPVPPARPRPSAPPTRAPLSVPLDATIRVTRRSPTRGKTVALSVIGASLLAGGFALGVLAHRSHVQPVAVPIAPPVHKIEQAPPVVAAPAPVPIVPVASLPRATVGTIVGVDGHRLWVDGKLAEGSTAVVACGGHSVQVGSAGTLRKVDVPCGDSIVVPP